MSRLVNSGGFGSGQAGPPPPHPRLAWLILAALVVLGVVVRALGLRLGLPFHHHWDEVWVVSSARSMLERGNDVPTSYQYGAPLSRLIVLAVKANKALRIAPPVAYGDETTLRWVGRIVCVAVTSSGTIPLYLAGRAAVLNDERASLRVGLYAAATYAFAYELVTHARFAVTDACLVTFCAWSIGFAGRYIQSRKLVWAVASLLAAGVSFAFKPTALTGVLIPALTLLFVEATPPRSPLQRSFRRALLMGVVPIHFACFFFLNPHYIDHWPQALRDLSTRIAQTRDGGMPWFMRHEPGLDHLSIAITCIAAHLLSHEVPIALALSLVALVGLFIAVRARAAVALVAVAHAGLTVLAIALPNKIFLIRNNLIAVPAMCLCVALGIEHIGAALSRRFGRRGGAFDVLRAAPLGLLVLAAGATAREAIQNQSLSADARMRAADFIEARAAGAKVSLALAPSVVGSAALGAHQGSRRAMSRRNVQLLGDVNDCVAVASAKPDYVITASARGPEKTWYPYIEAWPFRACPGYTEVARFEANPHEHTYWTTETWDGRVTAIVLKKNP